MVVVELILDYPTTGTVLDPPIVKTYQINVGEARVFAAAKYQGGVGTYLSIDAEDLEAWEITAQRPKALLLTRTIHKSVKVTLVFSPCSFGARDPPTRALILQQSFLCIAQDAATHNPYDKFSLI
jgi:hypothetical protein